MEMSEQRHLGNRLILGANGPNTHRILTPRGEEECVIALYDEAVPETFFIVLEDRTIEFEAICSYPKYMSFDVPLQFRNIRFINIPIHYSPSEVHSFYACPWNDTSNSFRKKCSSDLEAMDIASFGEYLHKLPKKVSKNHAAKSPMKRNMQNERALRQLSVSLKGAVAAYGPALSASEVTLPSASDFNDNVKLLQSSAPGQLFKGLLETIGVTDNANRFIDWATKNTKGKLADMLSRFPWDLCLHLGIRREKVTPNFARKLFWVWRACTLKMEEDSRLPIRHSAGRETTPPHVRIQDIHTVLIFPDGTKIYGRSMISRKHNGEEHYLVKQYLHASERRNQMTGAAQNLNLLTYKELAERLQLSVRRVKQMKAQNLIPVVPHLGKAVRFDWLAVQKALGHHGYGNLVEQ